MHKTKTEILEIFYEKIKAKLEQIEKYPNTNLRTSISEMNGYLSQAKEELNDEEKTLEDYYKNSFLR